MFAIHSEDLTPSATEGRDERISFQIEQNDLLALKAFHLQFLFFLLAKRQLHRRLLNEVFEIMLKASVPRQETQDISASFFFPECMH